MVARISTETPWTITSEIPAWDEHYVLLPGEYPLKCERVGVFAAVQARVVSAKKAELWGGVPIGPGTGPDQGDLVTVHIHVNKLRRAGIEVRA